MTYDEALEYIGGFTRPGSPMNGLVRFVILMKELGDPQNNFKTVHVAGTNGKGSVCEYVCRALRESGKRVGRFTSPYISCIEERIQINGKNISREAFALLCEKVKAAADRTGFDGYSQFEILCAIGMLYFSMEETEYVVLEVGIGGALDCTNIVTPEISVITSIGLDHTDLLGKTVEEIAAHKAGIIKPGVPCVCSYGQPEGALKVINDKCREYGAAPILPSEKRLTVLHMDISDVFFTYKGRNYHGAMSGEHQLKNLTCAIEVCEALGVKYGDIFSGIEKAKLAARLEHINTDGAEYIIDGAHNPPAMDACVELIKMSGKKKHAVIGMLSRKNWQGCLEKLMPNVDIVTFTDDFAPDAVSVGTLAKYAEKCDVAVQTADTLADALGTVKNDELGVVTGSLYLAGKARKLLLS